MNARRTGRRLGATMGAGLLAGLVAAGSAGAAETVYGLTTTDKLVVFSSTAPGANASALPIKGLGGEDLEGLDFRPATGQLYALGSTGRLYRIDVVLGEATLVGTGTIADNGTPTGPAITATDDYSLDFNPTVDRLRIVSDAEQNLRVNPNTGASATPAGDTNLTYGAGDPNIQAIAYTNNFPASNVEGAAPTTLLWGIDATTGRLVTINPPNTGVLNADDRLTLGGVDFDIQPNTPVGFDIATDADGVQANTAYVTLSQANATPVRRLYRVDLATGALTLLGTPRVEVPDDLVDDIAIAPAVPTFTALTTGATQQLVTFRGDRPGAVADTVNVTGLAAGDRLVGIDTRPADGQLYGVGAGSRVYRLDAGSGIATQIGSTPFMPGFGTATAASGYGIDFNPDANLLRLIQDTGYNARYSTSTMMATADTNLSYAPTDINSAATPQVTAGAYTNPVAGTPSTVLYDIDTGTDSLVKQDPAPNTGVLTTVGDLNVDATGINGFDIVPRFNQQFAALQPVVETVPATGSNLYVTNGSGAPGAAANGSAVLVDPIGLPTGVLVTGLTATNPDRIALASATAGVGESGGTVSVAVTRSQTTGGTATVQYTTVNGTAQSGTDYTATSGTLTFGPGESTKLVAVPVTADAVNEPAETFRIALANPTGGAALGFPSGATVTIADDDAPTPVQVPGPPVPGPPVPGPERVVEVPGPPVPGPPVPGPVQSPPVVAITGSAVRVAPARDRKAPFAFRVSGSVTPPTSVTKAAACRFGTVRITVRAPGRTTQTFERRLTTACTFAQPIVVAKKGAYTVGVRFLGSDRLRSRTLRSVRLRAG